VVTHVPAVEPPHPVSTVVAFAGATGHTVHAEHEDAPASAYVPAAHCVHDRVEPDPVCEYPAMHVHVVEPLVDDDPTGHGVHDTDILLDGVVAGTVTG
jgi:hypothetical protein